MYTEVHPHAIINHDPCPSTQTPVQSRQEDGSAVSLMCALMPASQQKKIEEMKMGPEIRRGNLTFVFLRRQLKRQHKTILLWGTLTLTEYFFKVSLYINQAMLLTFFCTCTLCLKNQGRNYCIDKRTVLDLSQYNLEFNVYRIHGKRA